MDRYRVYTNTLMFGTFPLDQDTWIHTCNLLIKDGWIPLGGMVHFGNTGLMQTMYKPY